MAFSLRSLDQISKAIRGDLRRELPGTDATIWPNTLAVFSKVVAMAHHLIELRAKWIYEQIFASTATVRHLERHAFEYGLARKPASRAAGYIVTTGDADTIYPAGISYLSGGVRYIVSSDARSDLAGEVIFLVHAETPGLAGNRAAEIVMTLIDPALQTSMIATAVVDDGGIGGGADVESDDALRARVLDRKRRPPQGGAESDYEQFALAVPGVVKAWAHSFAYGPGTVGVWFLFEGRANLIPTDGDVLAVQAEIDYRRLIRARALAVAPVAYPVNITIQGLTRDTTQTRAAIAASLAAMFLDRSRPGVAAEPFTFSRSWISEAIAQAIGEDSHYLTLPLGDLILNDGRMPVLGSITYV
jgi:uncharacterized phage protein gp47/JayE